MILRVLVTYKNTKTVLFGTLIAAMILPFSMAEPAQAQQVQRDMTAEIDVLVDHYNKIESERRHLVEQHKNESDSQKQSAIQTQIDAKVSAMSKILNHAEDLAPLEFEWKNLDSELQQLVEQKRSETDSQKRDSIQTQIDAKILAMDTIMVKYISLAPAEDEYDPVNTRSKRAITSGSTIYASGSHTACSNKNLSSSSTATGSIDTNMDTISWNWSITDHKNVGFTKWIGCNDVYFEEISFITRNNSKGKSCTMVDDNVTSGNTIQTCNCGLSNGNLISWLVQTTYEPITGTDTRGNDNWGGLHRVS